MEETNIFSAERRQRNRESHHLRQGRDVGSVDDSAQLRRRKMRLQKRRKLVLQSSSSLRFFGRERRFCSRNAVFDQLRAGTDFRTRKCRRRTFNRRAGSLRLERRRLFLDSNFKRTSQVRNFQKISQSETGKKKLANQKHEKISQSESSNQ